MYYQLIANDLRNPFWLLFDVSTDGPRSAKSAYAKYQCRQCRKLDELKCFADGITLTRSPRSVFDIASSFDLFDVVSDHFKETLEKAGIGGLRYFPIQADRKLYVIWPTVFAHDPEQHFGIRVAVGSRQCPGCGREGETAGLLTIGDKAHLPGDPMTLFGTDNFYEKKCGKNYPIIASKKAADILMAAKLKGLSLSRI